MRHLGGFGLLAVWLGLLGGCGAIGTVKRAVLGPADTGPKVLSGFIGGVAADEPAAALAAREVLALGGDAADAAVTLGFMLSVTLPSRAGLGGGGACLAYSPGAGAPQAMLFLPAAPAGGGGDRPAAVPLLARGLYLLGARYGSQTMAGLMAPAVRAANEGTTVSRALANDIAAVAGPLAGDADAAATFVPNGAAAAEGARLIQPALGATLTQLATAGIGDLYQGLLAHKLAEATPLAGGPITVADLRAARAALATPITVPAGGDTVAFLPAPADGGVAAAAALPILAHDSTALQAAAQAALAAATAARGQGGLPLLPASTGFVTLDRRGGAVACALTMNNLFGTGRIAPGTGIVLAASPAAKPPPLLAAGLAWRGTSFRAAVAASGQEAAGVAAAAAMARALAGAAPAAVPEPGRANAAFCPGGLPGAPATCRFATDPRGAGLATGG